MKKIIDAIRDFLYNITDYGLIITVIIVMALILGWRFEILFNRGIEKEVIAELPEMVEDKENDPVVNDPTDSEEPDQIENPEAEDKEEPQQGGTGLIATVEIPDGSFPSTIADILINSNLIEDKSEFLNRAVALGLDTRLRSGTFEIEVGTSLDNVIKIIANAQ